MLSKEEIQQLLAFVKEHKVIYVDVQLELVDHLATEIEMKRTENPNVDFQQALSEVYEKFSATQIDFKPKLFGRELKRSGFRAIIQEKEHIASKFLNKRMNDYFKSFFKLPRILFTTMLSLGLYALIVSGQLKIASYGLLAFLILTLLYFAIKTYRFQWKYGKFLSLRFQSSTLLALPMMGFLYPIIELIKWLDKVSFYYFPSFTAIIFTLLILSNYIVFIYFTNLLQAEVKEKYINHEMRLV